MEMKEYIQDHYGKCSKEKCTCLKEGWLGTRCPFWEPVKESSWEEMVERLKKEKKE